MKRTATLIVALGLCAAMSLGVSSCASYQRTVVVKENPKISKNKGQIVAADKHFRNGVKFYSQGKYQKAIKHFQKSLAKNPSNWEAHYYLGMSHREIHEYKLSTYRLELALNKSPKNRRVKSRIHVAFGLTYESSGHPRKANGSYALALELNPRNAKAQKGFDRVNSKQKKKQKKRNGHDHDSHGKSRG